jgi:hypothetical protein
MPTPFPGMDPYLEHPRLWPDVHNALIADLRNVLAWQVRPRYYVALEERTYMAEPEGLTFVSRPDMTVVKTPSLTSGNVLPVAEAFSGVTALEPVIVELPIPETVRETYLEIRLAETHVVVTVLELLSPANKRPGEGSQQYEHKRRDVLSTRTHWVEIDLLRAGDRMGLYTPRQLMPWHYSILVSRAEHRPQAMFWPFSVCQAIPSFRLPLQPGDAEPMIDLNQVLHDLYERAGYDLRIDYHAAAVPPLVEVEATWADEVLRLAGRR